MGKHRLIVAFCLGLGAGVILLAERRSHQHPRLLHTAMPKQVLQRVATIPIYRWSYRWSRPGVTHLGPMAQQFYAAFHVGESPRTLNLLDVTGVLLASVQALYAQVQELQARMETGSLAGQETQHSASTVPAV